MIYVAFLCPFFLSGILSIFQLSESKQLIGELDGFALRYIGGEEIALYIAANIFVGVFLWVVYQFLLKLRIRPKWGIVDIARLTLIFIIVVLCHIAFTLMTGVGVVLSDATSPFSPLFAMLNPACIFPIWYILARQYHKSQAWVIVGLILYSILKIMQGWTGFLIVIFSIELFIAFKYRKEKINARYRWLFICSLSFLLIPIGAIAYQAMYPMKMAARGVMVEQPTYSESLVKLTDRLTFVPMALGAMDSVKEISDFYQVNDYEFNETKTILRPLLPSFLMPDKTFRSLNNLVVYSYYNRVDNTTSSDLGLVAYLYVLYKCSPVDLLVWFFFCPVLLIFSKIALNGFEVKKNDCIFLTFFTLFQIYYTSSIEQVFSYGYVGLLFWMPLLILFRSFRR
ncbi:oligosaccharide repeat unit polymerase, partial [Chromobacterium haemolyticum]|uniref:oligosaccharide repeat unit polymerase n=1 Tax=Chromobacterium haemolyticum TaxID=394935 RepID=UPI0013B477AC